MSAKVVITGEVGQPGKNLPAHEADNSLACSGEEIMRMIMIIETMILIIETLSLKKFFDFAGQLDALEPPNSAQNTLSLLAFGPSHIS